MELNSEREITMIIVTHNLTMANLKGRNLKLINGALIDT
jgi:predicted ABC-type transport system involved in lysophospholipase L1 biosynthesis ATPase subunit